MIAFFLVHALTLAAIAVCILAWWKGSSAERQAAYIVGCAWISAYCGQLVLLKVGTPSTLFPYFSALIDGVTAVGLLLLAMRYSKLWLGGAVLIQASALLFHAIFLSGDGDRDDAIVYVARINALGAALILLMLLATVVAWAARHRIAAEELVRV